MYNCSFDTFRVQKEAKEFCKFFLWSQHEVFVAKPEYRQFFRLGKPEFVELLKVVNVGSDKLVPDVFYLLKGLLLYCSVVPIGDQ